VTRTLAPTLSPQGTSLGIDEVAQGCRQGFHGNRHTGFVTHEPHAVPPGRAVWLRPMAKLPIHGHMRQLVAENFTKQQLTAALRKPIVQPNQPLSAVGAAEASNHPSTPANAALVRESFIVPLAAPEHRIRTQRFAEVGRPRQHSGRVDGIRCGAIHRGRSVDADCSPPHRPPRTRVPRGTTVLPMSDSDNSRPSAFQLLFDARLNKAGAFTEEERVTLGLEGLLPDAVESHPLQLHRARAQFDAQLTDLGRYQFMSALHDRQERLFFALIRSDFQRFMPIVYTPTVGEACQRFGHIMRRPKGMYISIRHRGRIAKVLRNWPVRDIRFIVVTDGERILGLGDLGVCGMPIPIGKLALYTACAGVPPEATLPVVLDRGTNNQSFLEDPLYPGLRQPRVDGNEAMSFVDEFVDAVQEVFPRCCIQFEDFTNRNAMPMLARYRNRVCMFNDDIQGTAAVGVAGIFGACRVTKSDIREQRLLFLGAGNAGVGIADLFVRHLESIGVPQRDALACCHFMNSRGLVHAGMTGLPDYLHRYAHPIVAPVPSGVVGNEHSPITRLVDAVEVIRPTALIGVSAVPNSFDEAVIRSMSRINSRPIIFPLSNPTSKSECTAEEAIRFSDGRAIVATGSPFPPMHFQGQLFVPGQGNNVYIYPAIGMAVFATQARRVTDEMFLRAAESLAAQTTDQDLSVGLIFPPIASILEKSIRIAIDVASLVFDAGLARVDRPEDIEAFVRKQVYDPTF